MYVVHFRFRRSLAAAAASALLLMLALILFLPGCRKQAADPIPAGTEEQRLAYLTSLGWTAQDSPLETLDLLLPEPLSDDWADYGRLQKEQGLPFCDYAGQTVRRYTYALTNYPGIPQGVQANLFVCGDRLIGGDVICPGADGFQTGLAFPGQQAA